MAIDSYPLHLEEVASSHILMRWSFPADRGPLPASVLSKLRVDEF